MQIPDYISASYIKNCYKNTSLSKSKSSKKLASGYRINTAADDAAKLSISEKMRAQIRGLDQGVQNAQDAYSLCQTIDGKAQSCHALLQRIRELTLQAANGTNTDQDRGMIQQEVDQSIKELTRISGGLYDGSNIEVIKRCTLDEDEIREILRNYDFQDVTQPLHDRERKVPKEALNIVLACLGMAQFYSDLSEKLKKTITVDTAKEKAKLLVEKLAAAIDEVQGYGEGTLGQEDQKGWKELKTVLTDWSQNPIHNAVAKLRDLQTVYKSSGVVNEVINMILHITTFPAAVSKNLTWQNINSINGCITSFLNELKLNTVANLDGSQLLKDFENKKYTTVYRGIQFMLDGRNYDGSLRDPIRYEMYVQVGANAGHAIKLTFSHLDFYELYQTDVLSEDAANRMLQKVDQYQKQVSEFLTDVGSYQNRLQHTMEYAMEHAEIETGAESQIRDADYGKEAVKYAKQTLQQQVQESVFAEEKRRKEQMNQVLYRNENI